MIFNDKRNINCINRGENAVHVIEDEDILTAGSFFMYLLGLIRIPFSTPYNEK